MNDRVTDVLEDINRDRENSCRAEIRRTLLDIDTQLRNRKAIDEKIAELRAHLNSIAYEPMNAANIIG